MKKKINQRTGWPRYVGACDDYQRPHHLAFCGAKENAACPIKGCKYHARVAQHPQLIIGSYNESTKCPFHRVELVRIGTKIKIKKYAKNRRN